MAVEGGPLPTRLPVFGPPPCFPLLLIFPLWDTYPRESGRRVPVWHIATWLLMTLWEGPTAEGRCGAADLYRLPEVIVPDREGNAQIHTQTDTDRRAHWPYKPRRPHRKSRMGHTAGAQKMAQRVHTDTDPRGAARTAHTPAPTRGPPPSHAPRTLVRAPEVPHAAVQPAGRGPAQRAAEG